MRRPLMDTGRREFWEIHMAKGNNRQQKETKKPKKVVAKK